MKTEVQVIEAEDISKFNEEKLQALRNNIILKTASVADVHPKLRHFVLTVCSDFAVQNINPYCKPA